MRILLTGSGGFVAPYVVSALRCHFPSHLDILATGQRTGFAAEIGTIHPLDVTDAAAVDRIVADFRPSHVIHLAGITTVPAAAAEPNLAWTVNVLGTLNCARATLRHCPQAAFIFASSSQVYGGAAPHHGPLTERDLLAPSSEYGATKAAAELALGVLATHGLRTIRLRFFNHTGPNQPEAFVVPSFATQIVRIERREQPPIIKVGNLDAERDFLDVRDVAEAYVSVVKRAESLAPDTILNISSGKPMRIRTLLDMLAAKTEASITIENDPARWRENDIATLVGDSSLARNALDWSPRFDLSQTMTDILDAQRKRRGAP